MILYPLHKKVDPLIRIQLFQSELLLTLYKQEYLLACAKHMINTHADKELLTYSL